MSVDKPEPRPKGVSAPKKKRPKISFGKIKRVPTPMKKKELQLPKKKVTDKTRLV